MSFVTAVRTIFMDGNTRLMNWSQWSKLNDRWLYDRFLYTDFFRIAFIKGFNRQITWEDFIELWKNDKVFN